MARLGVSAAGVAAGLGAMERFRVLGLPAGSAAGDAARALFDHGHGGEAWSGWLNAGEGWVPTPGEPLPRHLRDGRIVELRAQGWTLERIGEAFGMTKGGVSPALRRLSGEDAARQLDW